MCKLCVCVCVFMHVCAGFLSCQCGLVGPCPVGASLTCSGDKGGRAGTLGFQSVGSSTGSRVEDLANLSAGEAGPLVKLGSSELAQAGAAALLSLLECGYSPPWRCPLSPSSEWFCWGNTRSSEAEGQVGCAICPQLEVCVTPSFL